MMMISIKHGLRMMDQETFMKEMNKFMGGDYTMGFGGSESMTGANFAMPDFEDVAQRILEAANNSLDRRIERLSEEDTNADQLNEKIANAVREFFNSQLRNISHLKFDKLPEFLSENFNIKMSEEMN